MHLEGSLSPELLFRLSQKNNIPLPSPTVDPAFTSIQSLYTRYENFTSLDDFLHYYYIGFSVLLTESDFEELAWSYLSQAAREGNLRHAEVFFDPQAHLSRGVAVETMVSGWERASKRAETELGVSSLLVPCLLRHLEVSDSEGCFDGLVKGGFFEKDAGGLGRSRLAGIGLCSTEMGKAPGAWRGIFQRAKELGIRRTSHAGEEGPAGFVAAALDELEVERIDHGVHAADDGELMGRLARERVLLTVCPVSNVRLKGVERIEQVPVRVFIDEGVRFSLNSDDPAYFGAYLQEVYCRVQEAFGLSVGEWRDIARNGVEGSWCSEQRKGVILAEIERVVTEWEGREKERN